ncbi:MAG TPA: M6 family metalloprotease domain-containing protein, partial [bacterium]|nr:M6 family metalloprotease domain-containing protein [bacterium]
MPFRYPFRGLFRCIGVTLAVLVTALLVSPQLSEALSVRPGVSTPENLLTLRDGVGANFNNYRGRNAFSMAPALRQSTLPQPDPLQGNVRALVLMVNDVGGPEAFVTTIQVHRERLFSEGRYNNPSTGRAGSVRDYYLENSHGMLQFEGEIWGPTNIVFDADNNGAVSGAEAAGMIAQALNDVDAFMDLSKFDNDGPDGISRYDGSTDDDGNVDMLIVIHAGLASQASGLASDPPTVMFDFGIPLATNDGVVVNEAILVPELGFYIDWNLFALGITVGDIGGIVHEMGHLFGLPDLYDVDNSSEGIGEWGLMGSGSWLGIAYNNIEYPGTSPAHLSSWSKYQLGWLNNKIQRLDTSGIYNLDAIATPPDLLPQCFHFWRPRSTGFPEYFLCEYKVNKPNAGAVPFSYSTYIFDSTHPLGIEDRGVVVWHIDDSIGSFANNDANVIDFHPRVMVVQADGRYDLQMRVNRGDSGDPFTHENIPPRDLLPDESSQDPTTYSYDGTPTGISMRTVAFSADSATLEFTFKNVAPRIVINKPNSPLDITRRNIFQILWWDADPDDDARIELYYSTSSTLASVAQIRALAKAIVGPGSALSEDEESDRYDWDTYKDGPSGTGGYVPDGQFYIYAVISDPVTTNWNVSRAPLTVRHDMPPTLEITKPYKIRDLADTSYEIRFKPWDDMVKGTTTVELWATSTTAGGPAGGVQIMPPTNLSSFSGDFRYVWDTTSMVGQIYHIYGVIKDQEWNPVVSQFSPGSILVDHKPKFTFMKPCVGCMNDATGTYTIAWQASDEESPAQINLFYSRVNNTSVNATQINTIPLIEGVDATYTWDFRLPFSVVGVGDYYIWARVDDGINPAQWFVSPVPVNIVEAVGANVALNNLVQVGQRIDSQSPPTAVIGMNLSDDGLPLTLDSIRVEFEDVSLINKIDPAVDFLPITGDSVGGIGLYRDSPTGLLDGAFDSLDTPVPFRFTLISPKQFLLIPDPPLAVPDSDSIISVTDSATGQTEYNLGDDLYVVVRTSENIELNDGFRARIPAGGLSFNNGRNMTAQVLTAPLLANVPTFLTDLSPEDGVLRERHQAYPIIGIGMADG